jgi:hypothetical protein
LYDFDILVVVGGSELDEGLSGFSGLFAVGLLLLGPTQHEAVVMTEHSRIVKLVRDLEDHFADGLGVADGRSEQEIKHLLIVDSCHSVCE